MNLHWVQVTVVNARFCAWKSFDHFEFAVIEHGPGNGGSLVRPVSADWRPGHTGILIYIDLNADGRIRGAVQQAEARGGEVLDPDGDQFALHSDTDA